MSPRTEGALGVACYVGQLDCRAHVLRFDDKEQCRSCLAKWLHVFTAQQDYFSPGVLVHCSWPYKKERGRSGEERGGGKWREAETSDFFAELLYATTSTLDNLDGTRTCSAMHVINLRVAVHCNFHNVTEHKQQMSRVVNSNLAVRLLGNLSQRTNAALSMEAPALWKKSSSSHWFCFSLTSVDLDRVAGRVGSGAEKRRRKGGRKEGVSAPHRNG